jgi:hypothetical protein
MAAASPPFYFRLRNLSAHETNIPSHPHRRPSAAPAITKPSSLTAQVNLTKTLKDQLINRSLTALVGVGVISLANNSALAAELIGTVQGAGSPIAGSTVTLYAAGNGTPTQLTQGNTDEDGAFRLEAAEPPANGVLYVIAKGSTPQAVAGKGPNEHRAVGGAGNLGAEDGHGQMNSRLPANPFPRVEEDRRRASSAIRSTKATSLAFYI